MNTYFLVGDTVVQSLTDQMGEMAMGEEQEGAWEF